jgi:hypothetical protein
MTMRLTLTIEISDPTKIIQAVRAAIPEIRWLMRREAEGKMNKMERRGNGGWRRIELTQIETPEEHEHRWPIITHPSNHAITKLTCTVQGCTAAQLGPTQ